jgi:GNAT superfamily N-acetyltransferase
MTTLRLQTRSGLEIFVRPVRADDAEALKQFFAGVSPEDLRFRFLTGLLHVSDEQIGAMVDVDHKQTEDLLAFLADGTLVASAMLAVEPSGQRGEVAIAVRADHKNKGIGWCLLHSTADLARSLGVKILEAVESREHHAAIEVERDSGFTVHPYPDESTLVIVRKQLG